jgi:2-polyprenyl-3-methyl-5-hydroxy-6-metoxy-1,4-benzoquinol methylase
MNHAEWVTAMKPGDWTTENRFKLKRFSHLKRFKKAIELVAPKGGDKILDYGCSDGYLLELLKSKCLNLKAYGYDPLWFYYKINKKKPNRNRGIFFTDNLDTLKRGAFNKITCLEVLEHLEESSTRNCLSNIKKLLSRNGTAIISVPIETGFSSLFKNTVRKILNEAHENTNVITIVKSLLMLPIKRRGDGSYILSHIGFDYKRLERSFAETGFKIVRKTFSPFPFLGSFINSQVFYVLRET